MASQVQSTENMAAAEAIDFLVQSSALSLLLLCRHTLPMKNNRIPTSGISNVIDIFFQIDFIQYAMD